ncbi:hypothetical protein [Planomonospora sphaerica]|uniref:hypothetical protein n=1 Tax=Planomonospora sphaerica TaxID=161355 RepID=UPI00083A0942|nr:hypothetical protein [Planomonospora sphaerica]
MRCSARCPAAVRDRPPGRTPGRLAGRRRGAPPLDALGLAGDPAETDPHRYVWHPVSTNDPARTPLAKRLLRSIADRQRTRARLLELQVRADGRPVDELPAIGEAA